jgi:hypothetical protein
VARYPGMVRRLLECMDIVLHVDKKINGNSNLPAKQAEGVGSEVGSDSAIFFSTCWSCGEESI